MPVSVSVPDCVTGAIPIPNPGHRGWIVYGPEPLELGT